MNRKRIALKVYYDGRYFDGFQRQPHSYTVEDKLLEVFQKLGIINGVKESRWQYASRTDKGVSALGQVIAFDIPNNVYSAIRKRGLMWINICLLPRIALWAYSEVPKDFNPRRDALSREYIYIYPYQGEDLELIRSACNLLSGKHDYSFIAKAHGCSTVRDVLITVSKEGDYLIFKVKGHSFYRYLIRKILGAILCIGRGELNLEKLQYHMQTRKALDIKPVESKGLILWKVNYENVSFSTDLRCLRYLFKILQSELLSYAYAYGIKRAFLEYFSSLL